MRRFFRRARIAVRALFAWVENNIVAVIPLWCVRRIYHLMMGMKIGRGSQLNMRTYLMGPGLLSIGEYTHVNPGCLIDYRNGVEIGSSVSISHRVMLISGGHDVLSHNFSEIHKPIKVGNHVTTTIDTGDVTTSNADITLRANQVLLDSGTQISIGSKLRILNP